MTLFAKFINLKWWLPLFMGVFAMASCGFSDNDDDDPPTYPIELLGTWQGSDAEITVEGDETVSTESLSDIRLVINPNGTFLIYERNEIGEWREKSRSFWQYNDKKLYVINGNSITANYDVLNVDAYRLQLKSVVKGDGILPADDLTEGDSQPVVPDGERVVVMNFMRFTGEN